MKTPEQQLFQAVILQAFRDAVSQVPHGASAYQARQIRICRRDARDWLLNDSTDLRTVCHWADLDPLTVRDRARILKRNGWAIFGYYGRYKFTEALEAA